VTYGSNPYANTGALYDVTSGSNGSCGGTYFCTARAGYDVHFAPFPYRPGTKTSILYTTQRD